MCNDADGDGGFALSIYFSNEYKDTASLIKNTNSEHASLRGAFLTRNWNIFKNWKCCDKHEGAGMLRRL